MSHFPTFKRKVSVQTVEQYCRSVSYNSPAFNAITTDLWTVHVLTIDNVIAVIKMVTFYWNTVVWDHQHQFVIIRDF